MADAPLTLERVSWQLEQYGTDLAMVRADLATVKAGMPGRNPWWVTAMLALVFTLLTTYMAIIHGIATRARDTIVEVWSVQKEHTHLVSDVLDLQGRVHNLEAVTQQLMPVRERQQEMMQKLDRLLEKHLQP